MALPPAAPTSTEEEHVCRICYEAEPADELVQPCACRGSSTWVHHGCLAYWRRTSSKPEAAYRCGQCGDDYRDELALELLRERLQRERKEAQWVGVPLETISVLGQQLQFQGKYDEAEPLFREALTVCCEVLGDRHNLETLTAIGNLASLLLDQGKLDEAEPLFREALAGKRETLGDRHLTPEHPDLDRQPGVAAGRPGQAHRG